MSKLVLANGSVKIGDTNYRRLFGPAVFLSTGKEKLRLGGQNEQRCAFKFVARQGGVPFCLKIKLDQTIGSDTKGTGGTLSVEIREGDETPVLTGQAIATSTLKVAVSALQKPSHVNLFFSNVSKLLSKGKTYWFVFTNTHTDAVNNFTSIGVSTSSSTLSSPSRWVNPSNFSVYSNVNKGIDWVNETSSRQLCPQFQLTYSDGRTEGLLSEGSGFSAQKTIVVTGNDMLQELFSIYGSKNVSGMSFVARCDTAGELKWSVLKQDSVLSTGTISETVTGSDKWYDVEFSKTLTFSHDSSYKIQFSAVSGAWAFASIRNESLHSGDYPSSFSTSAADFLKFGDGWRRVDFDNLNGSGLGDCSLPYVFHMPSNNELELPGNLSEYKPLPFKSKIDYKTNKPTLKYSAGVETDLWGRPIMRQSRILHSSSLPANVPVSPENDPALQPHDVFVKTVARNRDESIKPDRFVFSTNQAYSEFENDFLTRYFPSHSKRASVELSLFSYNEEVPNGKLTGNNMSVVRMAASYMQDYLLTGSVKEVSFFNSGEAVLSYKNKFTGEVSPSAFLLGLTVARQIIASTVIGHAQTSNFVSNLYGMRAVLMTDGSTAFLLIVNNDAVEHTLAVNFPVAKHTRNFPNIRTGTMYSVSAPNNMWKNDEVESSLQIVTSSSQYFVTAAGTIFGIVIPKNSVVGLRV